ncbi:hypothetical protein BH09BAC3_BH09BAC3_37780 [soil metagenome]
MRSRAFNIKGLIVSGILFFISTSSYCQNLRLIDSLKTSLITTPSEKRFDILNIIGFEYRYSYPDSTILYCTRAYELGKELGVQKTLARPLSFIGLAKANQGDYKSALDYQNRSISVAIEQRDTTQLAHGYNNIGRIFFDQGDLVRAYKNFIEAKDLFERIKDKSGLAYVYRSLATLFKTKKNFIEALQNSKRALALRKDLGDPRAITSAYMELGLVYEEMDSTLLALRQFENAEIISVGINDEVTKAELRIGYAEILFSENRIWESDSLALSVLSVVSEKANQKVFMRASLLSAKCKMKTKDYAQALKVLNGVYSNSEKSENLVFQREAAQLLSSVYASQKVPTKVKQYEDVYQMLDQKIQNADLNTEIERLQFQLQIEKAEKENESLKARQILDESLIIRQRSQNLLLILIALFVGVLAVVIYRVSHRRHLINKQLADQNIHILQQREEIAKQNQILSRSNRELDELNHEKDTLMNIVAHDLKSPLNRIFGLVRILEMEGALSKNQHEYIRLVRESTRGGLDLITDLLDVHAWKASREKLAPAAFDFNHFFRERILTFQIQAEGKGIELIVETTVDQRIISASDYIGRIIDNLVSNAIKFSPRQTAIKAKAGWQDGILTISVKDMGPGFSSDDKKLLFQKFKKLSARPTAGESSNGLGLAIVKTLVDRLGGSIELRASSDGVGSEFIIEIPAELQQMIAV